MPCPFQEAEGAELLLAYCARRLDADTSRWLERHVELCPECRAVAEQQKAVWQALDSWDALPVSEDFDVRLRGRIGRLADPPWPALSSLWRRYRVPLAAASILIGALLLIRSPGAVEPTAGLAGTPEVESVEAALDDIEMLRALELMASAGPRRAESL
ncbi:MAG: hypothetical protein RMI94_00900 [Bryobacterales bacterium]|nr:hypothetical protein [Bryobacteraceae bacterium]MDW8129079.1 hypothetical protein [Bryobacterales bacterium]